MKSCYECAAPIGNCATYCMDCMWARKKYMDKAINAVSSAVRRRLLPCLSVEEVACVDCGKRADRYDHRDYLKPLEVDPVCWWCNHMRGPAARLLNRLEQPA